MSTIGQRKADHLTLCAEGDVGFRGVSTLLECVRLVHNALPELRYDEVDLSLTMFGKRLRAPIVIAAMTGGTEEAGRINRELATIAQERGYAFGLGSQRAMHVRPETTATYGIRDVAPTALVLGNLGIVQARSMTTPEVRALTESVGADALCIHLNPSMELVQPGGDRDFSHGIETLERLVGALGVPVVVKETGCGISRDVGERLRAHGVRHVDVSGAGGTSWVGVETKRAASVGDTRAEALGEAFWDWGIPTGASVALLAPLGFETLIATGGIATGLDVARAVALGANAAGLARPVLRALMSGGPAGAAAMLDGVERELRAAMLLTGSRDLRALGQCPRVTTGDLQNWVDQASRRNPKK